MISDRPKASSIPDCPGSYQFKDAEGRVIYVGKAKSLRSRVNSYFQASDALSPKTAALMSAATSVEWIQVSTDVEALVLEYNLIKEHRPRYNVRLRDDKSYPLLALTLSDEWPKATVVRGKQRKGVRYFGPYPHASAIRDTLDLLLRTFPLRTCSDSKLLRHQKMERPCLLFHIERCSGPCIKAVSHTQYSQIVEELSRFLKGDTTEVVRRLERQMRVASGELEFETAARIRDRLEAVSKVIEKQEIVSSPRENFDVVGFFDDELEASAQVLHIRTGRLIGRKGFSIDKVEDISDAALVERILELQYGDTLIDVPSRILVPYQPEDTETLQEWISAKRGGPVSITVPQRGQKRRLMEIATSNAKEEFKRNRLRRGSDHNSRSQALMALQEELGLAVSPLRIECYDMSHLQGSSYVGSMVVMEDAIPKKTEYRRFRVSIPKNDDFAAMEEVLRRRLTRMLEERELPVEERSRRFSYQPNLLLVDGGKGQLSVAIKVVEDLGLTTEIELASLAKEFEEVFRPGESIPHRLPRQSPALYLLQQIRDEAHRFAITYHRTLRARGVGGVALDEVRGLGPKRRAQLLKSFGSIAKLRAASLEEIMASKTLPAAIAAEVFMSLHSQDHLEAREG